VPSPMYMRLPPFRSPELFSGSREPQTSEDDSREERRPESRPVGMNPRFLVRLAFVVVVLVALAGAFVQLAGGRRPVLLGGQTA
jgi:hypothetical protein